LPEKYTPGQPADDFPTPLQVFQTPIADLRSAGLSQRKAEYLQDLSSRFADGRLTAEKLIAMSDEEMRAALIAVRGVRPLDLFQGRAHSTM
jgi:DNA-3-methyladenine glycosylase II